MLGLGWERENQGVPAVWELLGWNRTFLSLRSWSSSQGDAAFPCCSHPDFPGFLSYPRAPQLPPFPACSKSQERGPRGSSRWWTLSSKREKLLKTRNLLQPAPRERSSAAGRQFLESSPDFFFPPKTVWKAWIPVGCVIPNYPVAGSSDLPSWCCNSIPSNYQGWESDDSRGKQAGGSNPALENQVSCCNSCLIPASLSCNAPHWVIFIFLLWPEPEETSALICLGIFNFQLKILMRF